MAVRKYASDYRLETHLDPSGKAETVRIYQGPRFVYCADAEQIGMLRKRVLLGAVLIIVCLLPLLFNNSQIGRTFYVILPMAFSLLPWYLTAVAGWRLGKFPLPLTREQKDQTDVRLRVAAVWQAALLGITFAGSVAYAIACGLQAGEWQCVAGTAGALVIACFLLTLRKQACTKQTDAN